MKRVDENRIYLLLFHGASTCFLELTNVFVVLFLLPESINGWVLGHLGLCCYKKTRWVCRILCEWSELASWTLSSPGGAGWPQDRPSTAESSGSLRWIWAISFLLALSPLILTESMSLRALSDLMLFSSIMDSFSISLTMPSCRISSRSWLIIWMETVSTNVSLTLSSSSGGARNSDYSTSLLGQTLNKHLIYTLAVRYRDMVSWQWWQKSAIASFVFKPHRRSLIPFFI